MPITYGLTEQGFVSKPLNVIKGELETALKNGPLGESAGTEPDGSIPPQSPAGQLVAIMCDGLAAMWDLDQAIVASVDPTSATGVAQDALCSITGTVRDPAIKSEVTGTCTGTPGTPLPAGRVATVAGTGARFLSATGTIAALSAWQASHYYTVGDRVTNGGNAYQCVIAGTSAGSGGPSGTGSSITDGGVTWRFLGVGSGAVDLVFTAEAAGPIGANAGTLSNIATPVDGWKSVTNLLDATVGSYLEGAASLRVKREAELTADALAAANAIRAHVLKVDKGTVNEVKACTVFVNDSDTTDGNGLPPHSVEVLVLGGLDAHVALAVWEAVGGGITTYGGTYTAVTDSAGNTQIVGWSRPTQVPIYIVADVLYDQTAGAFPSDGATLIQGALKTFGDTYAIGKDVRASALTSAVFDGPTSTDPSATSVPGVLDVSPLYLGTAPSPGTSSPVSISARQIATFDTSRITVNLTPGSP